MESPDASNNFHVDRESLKTVVLSKDSSVVDPAPVRVAHHVLGNVQGTDGKMIVADAESTPPHSARWSLKDLTMPSARLMWLFIDAYFERVHWFVFLFHEPSFRREARELLSAPFWSNSDRGKVVVMLQMAAVGLHTAQFDNGWSGLQALQAYSLSPESLVKKMVSEAQLHLLDVLEDCRIEAVQLSILLSIFHVYLGSRNLAWAMSALAIRMSYSLSIESEYSSGDLLTQQVRYRVWNHMTISDAFCALVYGRQGMIDINLSGPHDLRELDDTCLDSSLKTATLKYGDISTMSFHLLKAKLHEVICRIIASFRQLRFDRSVTETDMLSILRAIQEAEMSLEQWRRGLPVFFNHLSWSSPDPWETFEEEFNYLPSSARENAQILFRQATILQITYDGAIIMTHRKLLECKLPDNPRKEISGFLIDSIQRSLDTAAQAAFRISKVPFHRLDNHLAIHFVCMHAFTAGAILLIKMVNPSDTKSAMLARAAILRIIKACQTMRDKNRIARHADDLLSEMLRATLDSGIDEEASSSSPTMATTETLERPSSKVKSHRLFDEITAH